MTVANNINSIANIETNVANIANMLPDTIPDIDTLETLLSEPPASLVETMKTIEGDVVILGVAGKMGPTLARMAKRASDLAAPSAAAAAAAGAAGAASLASRGSPTHRRKRRCGLMASRRFARICSTRPRSIACRTRPT